MEIFYFNTQGEKIGPITKEGLINLAEAGVITEETVFEISGKKVKGKHIKNLRPIFERRKEAESVPEAEKNTFEASEQNSDEPETAVPEDIYQTATQETGPSDAAKAAYQHRMQRVKDDAPLFDTNDDESTFTTEIIDRVKKKLTSDETKETAAAFKKRVFTKFWTKKGKPDSKDSATVSEVPEEMAVPQPLEEATPPSRKEAMATRHKRRADSFPKDRVFTRFWRGYRIFTIFLHIVFVVAILFCLTGLYKGARWKIAATMGYRSLNSSLEDLLKTHKYEEFAQEVDRLSDVHPFRLIEGTLNKWNAPTSFEERTETLLSGRNDNVRSFEEMIAYLKKATDATYSSEVVEVQLDVEKQRDRINDEVKTAVKKQRERVNDLKRQIAEIKEPTQAQEQDEQPQEMPSPSTERRERKQNDITANEPELPRNPRQRRLRELEEQLKKEEERLRELQAAATLKDKGKVIDTLAPEKAKPYETNDEEIIVTPKSVSELHDVVHSYMKMMSVLFDDIHKTGENIYNLHKVHAVEILGGYLLLLFLCYFTATRVRMAEETQITRLILEERLISGNSNNGNS